MTGRALAAAVLCLAVRAAPPVASQGHHIFEHPEAWRRPQSVRVADEDLLFEDRRGGGFRGRSFYFTGYLNDEIHLEISLFEWRYSLFGGWGIQVVVAGGEDPPLVIEKRIPDRKITIVREPFSVRFGDSLFEGRGGRHQVSLGLEEFGCDLLFESRVLPWQPGDGYARLDPERGAYIRLGVPAPLARVSGYLSVAGRTRNVRGWGYADRSLIAVPINRMNSPTYAFRSFGPCDEAEAGWIVSLLSYESHQDFGAVTIPVLLLIEGSRWLLTTKQMSSWPGEFVQEPDLPVAYPLRFELLAEGERIEEGEAAPGGLVRLEGAFVWTSMYHYSDVFTRIPAFFRSLVEVFFERPLIFRFLGSFQGTLTLPDGTVRELSLAGHGEYTVIH